MRCTKIAFLIIFFCIEVAANVIAQSQVGQRQVINYQKQVYNAGTQNWNIRQDKQGRMYFANNEGVLIFDGTYWQLYPLPNKTIVRSIEFGNDDKLYVGGQDEIGYFNNNNQGNLVFHSLRGLISEADAKFSDIWQIVKFNNDIFFRSSTKLFRFSQGKMTVYNSTWTFIGISNGMLVAQDKNRGLMVFVGNDWKVYSKNNIADKISITSIVTLSKDSSLIITVSDGIYLLKDRLITPFKLTGIHIDDNQHFTNSINIGSGNFLVSTYTNGFYQINSNGFVTENIAKSEGLQNSNIRSMFMDRDRNVWLGLDNGIDFIAYNNAVKQINPTIFRDGGGFSVTSFNNQLFFGLSTGVFQLSPTSSIDLSTSKSEFKTLSTGQCWNLSTARDKLIAGKEDGLYQLQGTSFNPINKSSGFWNFQALNIPSLNLYAAGNYNGVHLFLKTGETFVDKGSIENFRESSRYLVIDSNNIIWVSHPYRGIYKIDPSTFQIKFYTSRQGLPSTLNNHVFKINNKVVVATEKGIFEYNNRTDQFVPSAFYQKIFGNNGIRYLKESPSHLIWFVQDKNVGVVDPGLEKVQLNYLPELKGNILSGFENIYPVDDQNIFIGAEKGFYHVNYSNYKKNIRQLNVYIRKVRAFGKTDTTLFGGFILNDNQDSKKGIVSKDPLNHNWNSIHFEYSSPLYEKESSVEYSCNLDEFDKGWSEWTNKTEKEYTNLPAGKYVFRVKARNHHNNDSTETSYSFEILPPWYQSNLARILYISLAIVLFYYLYKLQEAKHFRKQQNELIAARQKHDEEQKQTAYQHQLQMERSEKELIKLKNEKLESEIEHKNSELASAAMNLVQKKEFLLKIKDELEHFNKPGKDSVEMGDLKKILRSLSEEKKLNEEWEQFSIHFNTVQGDFLNIIQKKYPELKPHELKLCAYLRMNLSSKEIAQLMSISVRGVEISRYRLRKKLRIPTETNLFQFLFDLQKDEMNE